MGRSAADHTHLSIREVLDLLVGEFPDVTISKIRFLESRGLIHPERTPSGYRKFDGHDVERLRWILRQQREHFLPLKVIKGRLENGPAPSLFDTDTLAGDPVPATTSHALLVGSSETPGPHGSPGPLASSSAGEVVEPLRREDAVEAVAVEAVSSGPGPSPVEPTRTAGAPTEPGPAPAEASPGAAAGVGSRRPSPSAVREAPTAPEVAMAGGHFLSAEEMAQACGAEVALVEELVEYGLVTGRAVAGVQMFDEDELAVARAAAGLRRFGIEARHLRSFKHAAEREASLYGQVVTPLLRQRNPSARERAERELCELASLGAELRGVFLRAVLRDLTGG